MNIHQFQKQPLLGILRGVAAPQIPPLVDTVISSGLKTIEIAMNTKGAPALIAKAVKLSKNQLTIGAGTVLTIDAAKAALDSGATFIVSPVLIPEVVMFCAKKKIPVFPGAFSPLEIYNAWQAGATMVKVFPAKMVGPDYFREIKGPFPEIKLLACTGVTPENMKSYFESGTDAIAFGASVFRKDWLTAKNFNKIGEAIGQFVSLCKEIE